MQLYTRKRTQFFSYLQDEVALGGLADHQLDLHFVTSVKVGPFYPTMKARALAREKELPAVIPDL